MKTKQASQIKNDKSKLILLPLLILITVTPLIVHLEILPVDPGIADFWNEKANSDYFSYCKSILIITVAILSLITLLIGLYFRKIKIKKIYIYIPMAVFSLSAIISAALAEYRTTALYGFPDRYEGVFVLLAYMAVLFTAINSVNSEKHVKLLLISLLSASVIIGAIGIFQYFGYDFFTTSLGKLLAIPAGLRNTPGIIESAEDKGIIFSTLFNPNTLGMYMSMLFAISLSLWIFARTRISKILLGVISCLLFANLVGSDSRGAFISMLLSVFLVIILLRKQILAAWKRVVCMILCFASVFIVLSFVSGGVINTRIVSTFTASDIHPEDSQIDKIKDFEIDGSNLTLICTNSKLKMSLQGNRLLFLDDMGNELIPSSTGQNTKITLNSRKYDGLSLMLSKNLIKVQKGKSYLYFAVMDNSFYFLNRKGQVIKDFTVEKLGFEGIERLGSGRAYIWSRTLPLLAHTLLWGHGPDTFAMYFPQSDYKGKLNFMYDANLIIDKPHNMFLQTAVNTGVLSLIAFLCILAYYIVSSISLFRKIEFDSFFSKAGFAVFVSIVGYVISGLFTDSTVSVAPVFWVLLGIGISINFKLKNQIAG